MNKKTVWFTVVGILIVLIGGFGIYRFVESKSVTVPTTFKGHSLQVGTPNDYVAELSVDFADGHAYLTPVASPASDSPRMQTKKQRKATGDMLQLLTGSRSLNSMNKIEAGKTIDLGQVSFTHNGKDWTIKTSKWTFRLTDLGTSAFKDSNGTFWNLKKGSRVPRFDS